VHPPRARKYNPIKEIRDFDKNIIEPVIIEFENAAKERRQNGR
jgi:hypothetical protein